MSSIPTKRAFLKWDNSSLVNDFLQLFTASGKILGWIDSTGTLQGALAAGGSGAPSFSNLAGGVNTSALVVGPGGSLATNGSGTIAATNVPFSGITSGTSVSALVIGSGGFISASGTGTITATNGVTSFLGAPTGSCLSSQAGVDTTTGNFYSCVGGAWLKVGPGAAGTLSSPIVTPNPLAFDVNIAFKGPNPYVDITRFGARAVNQNVAPAIPGITANCVSGSPNVTISAASTFQNGDGVALYGCGSGTVAAPAAPTVTPSVLVAQTGLLLDTPGPAGSTTYCYQLVARTYMGATNVSPETCTTTGPASLGLQTVNITSVSLANNTATYTTSAPHGLVQYAHIIITGVTTTVSINVTSTPVPFNGWFMVSTVPDNTHFTVSLLSDTRNGTISSGTGGAVNYWNSIQIKATETANNYIYYVYGRVSGGTKTLIGAMLPQDVNLANRLTEPTYLAFDDLGSPVTTFPNPPNYIPTTVPTIATNDMLATTIVSGAGTTSLVLADNAGNTIGGQTILFDDAVTFLKAAKAACNPGAGTAGALMIPTDGSGNMFIFNSPISIGAGLTNQLVVLQKGTIWLNEPITTANIAWYGQSGSGDAAAAFANQINPPLYISRASPGFFITTNTFFYDLFVNQVSYSGIPNGQLSFLQEGGGIPSAGAFRNITFYLGTGGPTYSNMAVVFRTAGNGAGWDFTNTTIVANQNSSYVGTTPGMYFNLTNNVTFRNLTLGGVGAAAVRANAAGGWLLADSIYCQGCYMPYFSLVRHPVYDPAAAFAITFRQTVFDTPFLSPNLVPLLANYGAHNLTLDATNTFGGPAITGSLIGASSSGSNLFINGAVSAAPANIGVALINESYQVNDGIFGRGALSTDILYKNVSMGPGNSLFTLTGPPAPPTCPVSVGGAVPVGATQYYYAPIYANGSEGMLSTVCIATTTSGNQTVTINFPVIPGVTLYNIYRGPSPGNTSGLNPIPVAGPSYVDTSASTTGFSQTQQAAGGPAGMRGGLMWTQTMQIGDRATVTSGAGAPSGGLCTTSLGGKIYLRTDGTTTTTLYVCDGATGTWTAK